MRGTIMKRQYAREAAEAIAQVFDDLGGVQSLFEWAKTHQTQFYLCLWSRLLPKEVKGTLEVTQDGLVLNTVSVSDVTTALNTLERQRYASDSSRGRGGSSNTGEMVGVVETYEVGVSQTDGSRVGYLQTDDSADAASSRQDNELRIDPALPLSHDVPVA